MNDSPTVVRVSKGDNHLDLVIESEDDKKLAMLYLNKVTKNIGKDTRYSLSTGYYRTLFVLMVFFYLIKCM